MITLLRTGPFFTKNFFFLLHYHFNLFLYSNVAEKFFSINLYEYFLETSKKLHFFNFTFQMIITPYENSQNSCCINLMNRIFHVIKITLNRKIYEQPNKINIFIFSGKFNQSIYGKFCVLSVFIGFLFVMYRN